MEKALSNIRNKLIINFVNIIFLLAFLFAAIYFQVFFLPELGTPFPSQESVELAQNTSDAKKLKKFILMVTETNEEIQRDFIKMINTMFVAFYGLLLIALITALSCSLSIAKLKKNIEDYESNH